MWILNSPDYEVALRMKTQRAFDEMTVMKRLFQSIP